MAERGSWKLALGRPEAAISLPVGVEGDISAWAENTARSRCGYDADEELVGAYTRMILDAVEDSGSRQPVLAYLLPVEDEAAELVRIELRDLNPDEDWPEITLDQLEAYFAYPDGDSVEPAKAVRGELPAGPAVRVWQRYVVDADEFGDGLLMQTAAYAVRPHGTDFAVVLFASWRAVLLNEELFAMVDELARTLQVLPA
jgi:hypothetical protein